MECMAHKNERMSKMYQHWVKLQTGEGKVFELPNEIGINLIERNLGYRISSPISRDPNI